MTLKINQMPSPNHDPRADGEIDILVMHYTGMRTAEEALARLCDSEAKVSSHYTVDSDGKVYQHVAEDRRARHAGVSYWAGVRDVNSRSIGIEIVNPGHEFDYTAFPDAQIAVVIALSREILSRHSIPAARVVGHSDVAPNRKQDPGELFPWQQLAQSGIGKWPDGNLPPEANIRSFTDDLRRYGYGVPPDVDWPLIDVVTAFQRHFRPRQIDGLADAECAAILQALLQ